MPLTPFDNLFALSKKTFGLHYPMLRLRKMGGITATCELQTMVDWARQDPWRK